MFTVIIILTQLGIMIVNCPRTIGMGRYIRNTLLLLLLSPYPFVQQFGTASIKNAVVVKTAQ